MSPAEPPAPAVESGLAARSVDVDTVGVARIAGGRQCKTRHRSLGLGARLVSAIETEARVRGATALYLLTTTANTFFERMGYRPYDRAAVPPPIAATTELSSLCPDTADCLWRDLNEPRDHEDL